MPWSTRLIGGVGARDVELAVARAGCALLDREKTERQGRGGRRHRGAETLVRGPHSRSAPIAAGWSSASPKTSNRGTSCRCSARTRRLPEQMLGPDGRLRRRDGFTLTDRADEAARGAERDPLLRALPRARQGLVLEGLHEPRRHGAERTVAVNPLGIELNGCPLDEKISEMHMLRKRATPSARWRSSSSTTRCARAPVTASATTA